MYLLSPEGETLFFIPGVEVVHKVPTPVNIPREAKHKMKSEVRNTDAQWQSGGIKRPITLNVNSTQSAKKTKISHLLTSPDVQMLKLTTPELEQFLNQNPTLATPTPSGYICTKSVTKQQAAYTKDFQEALDNLKQTKPAPAGKVRTTNTLKEDEQDYHLLQLPTSLPHTTITYNHTITQHREGQAMDTEQFVVGVGEGTLGKQEEEEQDLSDGEDSYGYTNNNNINTNTSDLTKLERKRYRNRVAASKCRQRKLDTISQLEEKVAQLKDGNDDLETVVKKMKASVAMLKEEIMEHVDRGCQISFIDGNSFL